MKHKRKMHLYRRPDKLITVHPKKKFRLAVTKLTNHDRVIAGRAHRLGMTSQEYKIIYNAETTKGHTYKSIRWNDPFARDFFNRLRVTGRNIYEAYKNAQAATIELKGA